MEAVVLLFMACTQPVTGVESCLVDTHKQWLDSKADCEVFYDTSFKAYLDTEGFAPQWYVCQPVTIPVGGDGA